MKPTDLRGILSDVEAATFTTEAPADAVRSVIDKMTVGQVIAHNTIMLNTGVSDHTLRKYIAKDDRVVAGMYTNPQSGQRARAYRRVK